jgi:hypothetical protein
MLDLESELAKLPGIEVTLWPQFDSYDLLVEHRAKQKTWRVDVKDWSSPWLLARRKRSAEPSLARMVVSIPEPHVSSPGESSWSDSDCRKRSARRPSSSRRCALPRDRPHGDGAGQRGGIDD